LYYKFAEPKTFDWVPEGWQRCTVPLRRAVTNRKPRHDLDHRLMLKSRSLHHTLGTSDAFSGCSEPTSAAMSAGSRTDLAANNRSAKKGSNSGEEFVTFQTVAVPTRARRLSIPVHVAPPAVR